MLLDTSRAHIARLELQGFPPLTDEQLDRLEKAGNAVRPPFSQGEIDELRAAMHAVRSTAVEQANKAVQDIAERAGQIFDTSGRQDTRGHKETGKPTPDPFALASRPRFLTDIVEVADAAREDVQYLVRELPARQASPAWRRAGPDHDDFRAPTTGRGGGRAGEVP